MEPDEAEAKRQANTKFQEHCKDSGDVLPSSEPIEFMSWKSNQTGEWTIGIPHHHMREGTHLFVWTEKEWFDIKGNQFVDEAKP